MKSKIFLNGVLQNREGSAIGITDYGFNYGAGVYEVCSIYNGIPFQLKPHLERLSRSASMIGLDLSIVELEYQCQHLIEVNRAESGIVYFQVTFGDYGQRKHLLPEAIEATTLVFTDSQVSVDQKPYQQGIVLTSTPDTRWQQCHIKSTGLLPNLLGLRNAKKLGADDCVFVDDQSRVHECSSSNIFSVRDGVLFTPPESNKILSGITRKTLIQLAAKLGIQVKEEEVSLEFMENSDELFICSTTKEVLPVRSLNETEFSPTPGKITKTLAKELLAFIESETGVVHWKRTLW